MAYSLLTTLNKSLRTSLETESQLISTVLDKTTWEHFPLIVRDPTQQNHVQNNTHVQNNDSAERNPLPPVQCCFLQMPRDQTFFEDATTLLPGGRREERIGTATVFRKMLSKYAIFSTVFSKIVAFIANSYQSQGLDREFPSLDFHNNAIQIRSLGH